MITIRSGAQRIVQIGRHKVSPIAFVPSKLDILLQAAVDIMERQGASLTDRPRMIAAGEILSGGLSIISAGTGDRFRQMRRYVIHSNAYSACLHFNVMQSTSYSPPA